MNPVISQSVNKEKKKKKREEKRRERKRRRRRKRKRKRKEKRKGKKGHTEVGEPKWGDPGAQREIGIIHSRRESFRE